MRRHHWPSEVTPPRFIMILPTLAALAVGGCSRQPDREPVYPVSGKVLCEGEPAANAFVIFHPAEGSEDFAHSAYAKVDDQGEYRLSTYDAYDGAHVGEYVVTISWSILTEDGEDGPDQLKGRYANRESSSIRVTVKPEPNEIPPFEVRR